MMTRKNIAAIAAAVVGMAVISTILALSLRAEEGPDFTGMKPQEIKAYFASDAYRRLSAEDQRAIKEKAYGPVYQQREQEFIEQARFYSQLPPSQKVRFLDERIDELVRAAEQKRQQATRSASGAATPAGARGGSVSAIKPSDPKKMFASEDYRTWSEKMEPEKRAYIMEIKEAMRQRMEQRGIGIPGQGK